jgi:predicted lipoprotein with Yx(FWY)xxD motif
MGSFKRTRLRMTGAFALVGVAVVVAACGSSSSSNTSGSASSSATGASGASSAASAPSGHGVSVGTASGADGKYLVGASGRALYLWVADGSGQSSCSGACAKFWPPLTTKAAPVAAGGVTASQLGTITRSDGAKQVTYNGHPLYYFALDKSKGSVKGQGNNGFGAKWWLVAPSGSAITKSGGSSGYAPASSSSSSSSGGGGWG